MELNPDTLQALELLNQYWYLFLMLSVWEVSWKGFALWMSARRGHWIWFIACLVIHSLAILPIIYIFLVGRNIVVEEEEIFENEK